MAKTNHENAGSIIAASSTSRSASEFRNTTSAAQLKIHPYPKEELRRGWLLLL
jgi:hypothetical protein